MSSRVKFLLGPALCCLLAVCVFLPVRARAGSKPVVFVSIVPQKYFLQKLSGDTLDIRVMVEPGASPSTYEPKPRQMALLSRANAYFAIGVPFEDAWLPRLREANPGMEIIHTDHGIKKLAMAAHHHEHGGHEAEHDEHEEHGHHDDHDHHAAHEGHDHDDHDHEGHAHEDHHDHEGRHEHHHHHDGLDPHIWLSPELVAKQAQTMTKVLCDLDPDYADKYRANLKEFLAELKTLDAELAAMLKPAKSKGFLVFHPSWGYFAQTYGLHQTAIEVEGKEPGPRELAEIIAKAKAEHATTVFVQPQFSQRTAQAVADAIGGDVVAADPLARDWDDNLRRVAKAMAKAAR